MSEENKAVILKLLIEAGVDVELAECMVISGMKAKEKYEREIKKGKHHKK